MLPRRLLQLIDISGGDPLEVLRDGDRIVLRKHQPGCIFCGKAEDLILYRHRKVCRHCIRTLAGDVRAGRGADLRGGAGVPATAGAHGFPRAAPQHLENRLQAAPGSPA